MASLTCELRWIRAACAAVAVVVACWFTAAASAAPGFLQPPFQLPSSDFGVFPDVAVAADGTAYAVWERGVGGASVPATAVRPPGGEWTYAGDLGTSATGAVAGLNANPRIGVAGDGTATAVWIGGSMATAVVYASTRPRGGTWSAPEILSGIGANLFRVRVAVNAGGAAVAVWQIQEPGHPIEIQARFRGAREATWRPVETVRTQAGVAPGMPDVGIDAAGNAVVIWAEENVLVRIRASRRPVDDPWPNALQDLSGDFPKPPGAEVVPDLDVAPGGRAIAAWAFTSLDAATEIVQASLAEASGGFATAVPVSAPFFRVGPTRPAAAVDDAGRAVVAWSAFDNTVFRPNAAVRPAGGSFAPPQVIGPGFTSNTFALGAAAVMTPQGDATVAWNSSDSGTYGIWGANWSASSGFWSQPAVNLGAGVGQPPRAALGPGGDVVAVWAASDNAFVVKSTTFDRAGPVPGAIVVPTTARAGDAVAFSIGPPADAWSGSGGTVWSFGDGATAPGTSVSHTFAAPGRYTVSATQSDGIGNTTTVMRSIVVTPRPPGPCTPVATAVSQDPVLPGHELTIRGCGLGTEGPGDLVLFQRQGRAPVFASVVDGCGATGVEACWKDDEITIVVPDVPSGPATVTVRVDGQPIPNPLEVEVARPPRQVPVANIVVAPGVRGAFTFDARFSFDPDDPARRVRGPGGADEQQTSGGLEVAWNYNDGVSSRQPVSNHRFNRPGRYRVSLRVRNPATREVGVASTVVVVRPRRGSSTAPPARRLRPVNIHIPAQIVFDFGSAQLRQGTGDILGRAATLAKRSRRIVVTGYTDTIGAATFNKLLSGERALAVKAALVRRRVRATLVRTVAGGETTMFSRRAGPRGRPVTGERGLQLNRRVRVTVYLPEAVVRL